MGLSPAILAVPVAAAVGGLVCASVWPTSTFWGPVIARGSADGDQYALTFDDGPTPGATDRILDILHDLQVKAAFFVIGVNVRRAPDLLRRIHEEGHLIANHTWSHSHYGLMHRRRYWEDEIRRTDELIESIIGVRPRLFRPPMGWKTGYVSSAVKSCGHDLVAWSLKARDGFNTTAGRIVDRIVPRATAGDIVLIHDGVEPHSRRDPSAGVQAVAPVIDELRQRGLTPVRLDELIGVQPYADSAVRAP